MTDAAALNRFLASVEKRAFRMAQFAVKDVDDALDIVQDTMMALAKRYAGRPEAEWKPLFYRILRSKIIDCHRRRQVRNRWFVWLNPERDDEADDPIEQVPDGKGAEPDHRVELEMSTERLLQAVDALPQRQQQAFLLRAWEGFDVAGTAKAMGCSAGTVKTHYSRAVHALRSALEACAHE
ncbi:MAG: RNA polymerase sigma factor [Pseudomonadales bacterium]